MFLISCPYCGERDESEFSCAGEAHIDRPLDPNALNEEQWADYVFNRTNPKGWHREQWQHTAGCRRFFNMIRHTVTYKIHTVYKIGERPPMPTDGEQK